jgi:hypothetical protein
MSVERHPQHPQLLAPRPTRARTGIQATPTTHPNGRRKLAGHTRLPSTLGPEAGSSRSQPLLGRREAAFPPPYTGALLFPAGRAAILLGPFRLQPPGLGTAPSQVWLSGHCCCSPPDSPIGSQLEEVDGQERHGRQPKSLPGGCPAQLVKSDIFRSLIRLSSVLLRRLGLPIEPMRQRLPCGLCPILSCTSRPFVDAPSWRQMVYSKLGSHSAPFRHGMEFGCGSVYHGSLMILPMFPSKCRFVCALSRGGWLSSRPVTSPVRQGHRLPDKNRRDVTSHLEPTVRLASLSIFGNSGAPGVAATRFPALRC